MKSQLFKEQKELFERVESNIDDLMENHEYSKARDSVQTELKKVPNDPEWRLFRAGLSVLLAECYLELDEEGEAESLIHRAIKDGWKTEKSYSILGWIYHYREEFELAENAFTQALQIDPNCAQALTGRSLVFRQLNELEMARQDIQRACLIDPNYVPAHILAVETELILENYDRALELVIQAKDKFPGDPDLALFAAQLYAVENRLSEAIDAIRSSDELTVEARALLVELLIREGNYEEGRKVALQSTNLYPDEAFAFVQLAAVQLLAGKHSVALKAAERSVELDPSIPDAYFVRAAAKFTNDDLAGAEKDLEIVGDEEIELPDFIYGYTLPCCSSTQLRPSYDAILKSIPKGEKEQPSQKATKEKKSSPFDIFSSQTMNMFPGGFDPTAMLSQIFDSQGNVLPMFKPILRAGLKNASSMLKHMPEEMLKGKDIDLDAVKNANLGEMSEDEFEEQLKAFYKMMTEGKRD